MKNIFGILFLLIILFFTLLMVKITLPYTSFRYDTGFLLTKQAILHVTGWRWGFYLHIFSSVFILCLGALQFIPIIITKYTTIHRLAGKTYIFLILFVSGPGALLMSFYANGGLWAKFSFVITSILWTFFTLIAYLKIRKKEINGHIEFMVRSYALTLTAITLRLYVYFLSPHLHLKSYETYAIIAWLSWIPNLIIAEILIRMKIIKQ